MQCQPGELRVGVQTAIETRLLCLGLSEAPTDCMQPAVTLRGSSFYGEVLCGDPEGDSVVWCGYCIEPDRKD